MRLSEAMMLGDSLRTRDPESFVSKNRDGSYCGCAIGGASIAVGKPHSSAHEELWPWLGEKSTHLCGGLRLIWEVVIGIYGDCSFLAVCGGFCTFEQLVDYVRSIEPECGECNRFECICKPAAIPEFENELISAASQR